jgi:hypothetical protein
MSTRLSDIRHFAFIPLQSKIGNRHSQFPAGGIAQLVERVFQLFLTTSRNALYIGKVQTPFDPIYQRQYQIQYQMAQAQDRARIVKGYPTASESMAHH